MENKEYAYALQEKLVSQFRQTFYEKLGYYPIIITEIQTADGEYKPIMTLDKLKSMFDLFLPEKYGKKLSLETKRRYREIVELRLIYCSIARGMKYSLKTIGETIGNRDHTTVIHNVNTFNDLYETSYEFRTKYATIVKYIKDNHEPSIMDYVQEVQLDPESDVFVGLLQQQDNAGDAD
ncbi:MAG: helix-turn-helix domain-containing protein [Fluviibacter sp.]